MNADEIWGRFQTLRTWSSKGLRAPHKPLLALWAIGRCLRGEPRMVPFALVDRELAQLLDAFGPRRTAVHTEFPFWRMRNDRVWEIDRPILVSCTASGDAHRSSLAGQNIHGGLLVEDYQALRAVPDLAWQIAESLLDAHFPDTYHDDILKATGFDASGYGSSNDSKSAYELGDERARYEMGFETARRRKRDPAFRAAVLAAYGGQCAVCKFDVRMFYHPVAVEAAHIHWHKASGPGDVQNGLALCSLHHRLFDRGAFTLSSSDLRISVAEEASGHGFDESLGRFDGQRPSILPQYERLWPAAKFLRWHHSEVFRARRN